MIGWLIYNGIRNFELLIIFMDVAFHPTSLPRPILIQNLWLDGILVFMITILSIPYSNYILYKKYKSLFFRILLLLLSKWSNSGNNFAKSHCLHLWLAWSSFRFVMNFDCVMSFSTVALVFYSFGVAASSNTFFATPITPIVRKKPSRNFE